MEGNSFRNIKEIYKIEGTIGKGSFATVKRVKRRATGERYAVKVLSKRKMNDEDRISMQTEIEILKSLDHPNVVKLIDIFEDERHWCLVMELMTGGELFDQIIEKDCFSEIEAREATRAIIEAIEYCHTQGIVHRDIKPENLLLQSKEMGIASLKIADFGLARFLPTNTLASTTCGTPGYVAPEVLMQKPYGKECDYWSIGVVTFILLSGSPPFYAEDNFALYEQIKACKFDFDIESWSNISAEAKDFISQIFVAEPNQRMDCKKMLNHPWMNMELNDAIKISYDKTALSKYVMYKKSKETQEEFKAEEDDDDD